MSNINLGLYLSGDYSNLDIATGVEDDNVFHGGNFGLGGLVEVPIAHVGENTSFFFRGQAGLYVRGGGQNIEKIDSYSAVTMTPEEEVSATGSLAPLDEATGAADIPGYTPRDEESLKIRAGGVGGEVKGELGVQFKRLSATVGGAGRLWAPNGQLAINYVDGDTVKEDVWNGPQGIKPKVTFSGGPTASLGYDIVDNAKMAITLGVQGGAFFGAKATTESVVLSDANVAKIHEQKNGLTDYSAGAFVSIKWKVGGSKKAASGEATEPDDATPVSGSGKKEEVKKGKKSQEAAPVDSFADQVSRARIGIVRFTGTDFVDIPLPTDLKKKELKQATLYRDNQGQLVDIPFTATNINGQNVLRVAEGYNQEALISIWLDTTGKADKAQMTPVNIVFLNPPAPANPVTVTEQAIVYVQPGRGDITDANGDMHSSGFYVPIPAGLKDDIKLHWEGSTPGTVGSLTLAKETARFIKDGVRYIRFDYEKDTSGEWNGMCATGGHPGFIISGDKKIPLSLTLTAPTTTANPVQSSSSPPASGGSQSDEQQQGSRGNPPQPAREPGSSL